MKGLKAFAVLVLGALLFSGCSSAPMAGAIAYGVGAATVSAWEWKEGMKEVDWRDSLDVEFDKVWTAAQTTVEEMKIEVVEEKLNEEKNGGIITGKTNKHEKIQIIVGAATPAVTEVGIKARIREMWNRPMTAQDVDGPFAAAIGMGIRKKCKAMY